MLTQTAALFLDAYRELNARKMFWVVLALSLLVVAAFATVGINANGVTVLWFEFPSLFNTKFIPPAMFYKILFASLGVGWWLNWVGVILALVSTAGIIPEFIAGGSVDLYLSKPISRLRLFLTKYATGLLFVTLQVALFAAACFVLIGLRAGVWDVRLFLAIPIVVCAFSYLFCICALLGVLTRSTVAALLLTVLFWLTIFGVETSERLLFMNRAAGRIETQAYKTQFASLDRQEAALKERIAAGDAAAAAPELEAVAKRRRDLDEKKRLSDPRRDNIALAHRILDAAKTVLPKKAETNLVLQRWLNIDTTDLDEQRLEDRERRRTARSTGGWLAGFKDRTETSFNDPDVIRELRATTDARPASRVLGTSLAFEAVILALAAWLFCRRDY